MRRVLFWLAIAILGSGAPAAAETLTLYNCATESLRLRTFNEADGLCWIARSEQTLAGCGTVTFDCVGTCKVEGVSSVNACASMPKLDGAWVIPKGKAGAGEGYLQTVGQVDRWRGTPNWGLVCACSDAEMQF